MGPHQILIKLTKFISEIVTYVNEIFNECLTKGIFQILIKQSKVKILHKKGDKNKFNYYRPTLLLNNLLTIFEKSLLNNYKVILHILICSHLSKTDTTVTSELLELFFKW